MHIHVHIYIHVRTLSIYHNKYSSHIHVHVKKTVCALSLYQSYTYDILWSDVIYVYCYCVLPILITPEIFTGLLSTLEQMRKEEFTWDEDINFLQDTFQDPHFLGLCDVNDKVANSQSFEQPIASSEEILTEVRFFAYQLIVIVD